MVQASRLDEWVERLDRAAVSSDSSMRRSGMVSSTVLHVLSDSGDPPYVGSLVSRPFEPGGDAARGGGDGRFAGRARGRPDRGVLGTHVPVDRVGSPRGARFAAGPSHAGADRTDHEVRFPPFLLATAPDDDCASPVAVPEWGPVTRSVGSAPPEPVWRLLRIWQTQPVSDEDTTQTPANLERCQRMFWTQQRSAGAVRHCILGCAGQCSMLRSSSQPCS